MALAAGPGLADAPERIAPERAPQLVVPERAPQRVVSMNLCTDQYALMLAAPGQLVSVSHVAADPLSSPMAGAAAGVHLNYGGAEQIYLLQPDLVLAHPWSDPTALAMLRRLGLNVVQVPGVERLFDIPARLAEVGALLGQEDAAQTLIRRFETDFATLSGTEPGPGAVLYGANGYTVGDGSLADEMLTRAGFRNIAAEIGRSDSGRIALELLVMAAPDLIVRSQSFPGASRAEEILHHPALMALIAAGAGLQDSADWTCGTPRIVNALRDLVAARQAMGVAP
jgi:iron complex transport system substrate-binding protein